VSCMAARGDSNDPVENPNDDFTSSADTFCQDAIADDFLERMPCMQLHASRRDLFNQLVNEDGLRAELITSMDKTDLAMESAGAARGRPAASLHWRCDAFSHCDEPR